MEVRKRGSWCEMDTSLGIEWVTCRLSPAGKNVGAEAEDIVGIRYQATTDEDLKDWEHFLRAVMNSMVCDLAIALYLLLVTLNKYNS
jgi:hypothetical protein